MEIRGLMENDFCLFKKTSFLLNKLHLITSVHWTARVKHLSLRLTGKVKFRESKPSDQSKRIYVLTWK
ncbi:UNVERIFIED_CONTAM: hypothetical protein PYX00_009353 [Menopon gallinae]|uniref:Ribosomal protein L31 n=1 Tax=Menopon gallinae TaxID=328185 RepID=A0AAW2HBN2_9NEOP